MTTDIRFPLRVFYDGSCMVCAREMSRYRSMAHQGRLLFTDISSPDFDPAPYHRTREVFMSKLHVLDAGGRFLTGVDGFLAIWQALPGRFFRRMGAALSLPGIHVLAQTGYWLFARLRRYLPESSDCADDRCGIGHRKDPPET